MQLLGSISGCAGPGLGPGLRGLAPVCRGRAVNVGRGEMDFTYTVRALQQRVRLSPVAWEVKQAGAVITVRRGDKVVKQFPRVRSERRAHQLARAWIRRVQRTWGQAQACCVKA